jgi:hypothetical protein
MALTALADPTLQNLARPTRRPTMGSNRITRWKRLVRLAAFGLLAVLAGIGGPAGAGVAWAEDELFVANQNENAPSVTVYARTASGDTAPLRRLAGPNTGLIKPRAVAIDTVHDELFVSNPGDIGGLGAASINVYTRTASGDAAPLRTITGPGTGLREPGRIIVDTVHDEIFVANQGFGSDSITVYARSASGNAAPIRTLAGPATGLVAPLDIVLDSVHDELIVGGGGASTEILPTKVTVYSRTASGNTAPLRTLVVGDGVAPTGGVAGVSGVFVDTVHDELVVAPYTQGSGDNIRVYARTASGNAAPLRTLQGSSTGLNVPTGVLVDTARDELFVSNLLGFSITVYARTASGDTAPLRTLKGASTALDSPTFIALAPTPTFGVDFSGAQYAERFREVLRGSDISTGPDLGGTGHQSLNFTGFTGSAGATWLTVYDETPLTPAAGPTFGAETLCVDVLFARFNNIKGAGVVALLNEQADKRGLALVVSDAGNTDLLRLATVEGDPAKQGKLTILSSVPLRNGIAENVWYRLVMTVDVAAPRVTGKVFTHTTPLDPDSALGAQLGATLTYEPSALPAGVSPTGENGIVAQAVSAVVDLSVTNFSNDPARCVPSPPAAAAR